MNRWGMGGRFAASTVAVAALGLLGQTLSPIAGAQEPARPQGQRGPAVDSARGQSGRPDDGVVKLGADLVLLDVTVVDHANRPVFDLPKDRFTVVEDGVQQSIAFFNREQAPVSLGLVVDSSGSMRTKLEAVVQAVTNLVRTNKPQDEVAVIDFKDEVNLLEEFTTDEGDVEDALGDLIASGQTALLDALMLSADYVQKEGRHRRKALVIVTDGVEKGSYYSYEQVAEHLQELDIRLYLIGFTQDLDETGSLFKKSQKKRAEQLVNKMAEDTGGRAFFPKEMSELGAIGGEIAVDLRTVYALGYYPTNDKKDGSYRKVQVKMAGDGKLAARTRAGYYAEKAQ